VPIANRIHIFGASGSGTSTLAAAISARFGYAHLDTDSFFWIPTDPPFQTIREVPARQRMLADALDASPRWVLSGSLCGWGDIFIPRFDVAIFLLIPHEVRMARIMERERQRYGDAIAPGGTQHAQSQEFLAWAAKYDTGDESVRSLRIHEKWMTTLGCRCIRLEGELSTDARLARLSNFIG
jgi:adenylate kinase family enzyme